LAASIPLVDLSRIHAALAPELGAAFQRVLRSGNYLLGPETAAFEQELAAHEGHAHAVGCGSGSDALLLALRALGVGPGDVVATVANSFLATAESIVRAGARPVFVEPDPESMVMDPEDLRRVLREAGAERIRAVIPVHLAGRAAPVTALRAVLREEGRADVHLLGDAAQSHGAEGVSALTPVTCLSFYPAKNLGALGDGGAVLTSDATLAERIRSLRNHGRAGKHHSGDVGLNSRFDEVQAAVLRVKLPGLRAGNRARREVARRYRHALAGSQAVVPEDSPEHVYHLFIVRVPARDRLAKALEDDGIGVGLHYPVPVHHMPPYPSSRPLPVTERLCGEVLSLPCFPGLRDDEVDHIALRLRHHLDTLA
jgi:dTDP-4-amino-4,6-dideoxygalactose transaminase